MDKKKVIQALLIELEAERESVVTMALAARDEATHGESRPENQYDTRALEASYLAAGQGRRLEALDQLIGWVRQQKGEPCETAREGAILELCDQDDRTRWVMLAPEGGAKVDAEGQAIELISPASPLGQSLSGLEVDDVAEVDGPHGVIEWAIEAIY